MVNKLTALSGEELSDEESATVGDVFFDITADLSLVRSCCRFVGAVVFGEEVARRFYQIVFCGFCGFCGFCWFFGFFRFSHNITIPLRFCDRFGGDFGDIFPMWFHIRAQIRLLISIIKRRDDDNE